MVGHFQGFARDLHDLTTERLIAAAGIEPGFASILTEGLTSGRRLDRGNADLQAIKADFRRVGLRTMDLSAYDRHWATGDSASLDQLIMLRNALAHGNERDLSRLRQQGVNDTVSPAAACSHAGREVAGPPC